MFTRVVLPPSLKRVWPALVSQIIIVMLGSAVCGQISTPELSYAANLIRPFTVYACLALMYFALCYPISAWSKSLERKLHRGR